MHKDSGNALSLFRGVASALILCSHTDTLPSCIVYLLNVVIAIMASFYWEKDHMFPFTGSFVER